MLFSWPSQVLGRRPSPPALQVLIARDLMTGIWSAKPVFWLPAEGLAAKAQADRVPYDLWAKRGLLMTAPGATVSYEYVAQYLWREIFTRHHVVKIAFDRWNFRNFTGAHA